MKVFTCNDFNGLWPVPTAAVIVAETVEEAEDKLNDALKEFNLSAKGATLHEIDTSSPCVNLLSIGDY